MTISRFTTKKHNLFLEIPQKAEFPEDKEKDIRKTSQGLLKNRIYGLKMVSFKSKVAWGFSKRSSDVGAQLSFVIVLVGQAC